MTNDYLHEIEADERRYAASFDEYDSYREDELAAAREDAAYDDFIARATQCPWDGTYWDEKPYKARWDEPAGVEVPECPKCGMGVDEAQECLDEFEARHLNLLGAIDQAEHEGDTARRDALAEQADLIAEKLAERFA